MSKQILLMLTITFCVIIGCSRAQQSDQTIGKTALIVYLSRTRNTQAIAEIIHKQVGGKLVSLELVKPYPENYQAIVQQVVEENASRFFTTVEDKD